MAWQDFIQQIQALQVERHTQLVLKLNPRNAFLPHYIQRYDDPFLPFGKAVIQATQDLVCAYLLDLAAYLSIGAAGAIALERTIAYLGGATPVILHAPFTGQGYSAMADTTGFGVQAITVMTADDLQFYLQQPPFAAFVMGHDDTVPEQGGSYHLIKNNLCFQDKQGMVHRLQVTDDAVLYADGTDTFAETLRQSLERIRK